MFVNIQIMRGIASILVIWVHAQTVIPGGELPEVLQQVGFGGVDLFFVISGFIIVQSTSSRRISPADFLIRRFLRVAPLYYVFTLLVISLGLAFPRAFNSTIIELHAVVKSFLFIPFEKSPERIYPIYFLGWTLNYEMFFYALFSVALFWGGRARFWGVVGVLGCLAALGYLFIDSPADYGVVVYFYTRPIILDFALGMVISRYAEHLDPRHPRHKACLFAVLAVGCLCFVFFAYLLPVSVSVVAPPTETLFRFGVPAFLIIGAAVGLDKMGLRIGNDFMGVLGDASYSIYLAHFLMVGVLSSVASKFLHGEVALTMAAIAIACAATGFGVIVYHVVERPLSGGARHLMQLRERFR